MEHHQIPDPCTEPPASQRRQRVRACELRRRRRRDVGRSAGKQVGQHPGRRPGGQRRAPELSARGIAAGDQGVVDRDMGERVGTREARRRQAGRAAERGREPVPEQHRIRGCATALLARGAAVARDHEVGGACVARLLHRSGQAGVERRGQDEGLIGCVRAAVRDRSDGVARAAAGERDHDGGSQGAGRESHDPPLRCVQCGVSERRRHKVSGPWQAGAMVILEGAWARVALRSRARAPTLETGDRSGGVERPVSGAPEGAPSIPRTRPAPGSRAACRPSGAG